MGDPPPQGPQGPRSIEEVMAFFQDAFNGLAAQQANTMAVFADRLASIEENRTKPAENLQVPPFTPTSTREPSPTPTVRPRPSLPHPDKFDGRDLSLYPQFEGFLQAKLHIDAASIGGETEQVWYAYGRLAGEAAGRIYPWVMHAQNIGTLSVHSLFTQMRLAFSDPRQHQKALSQLNRTKQRGQLFSEFLNDFNRLILEAEGWGWDDKIKKGYLKAALSTKLLTATIGIEEKESYEGYCSQLRKISDQQAEVAELTAWRTYKRDATPRTPPLADPMDWEPTVGVAAAHANEPRWALPAEIERRRRERLCFRCGKEGHRVRNCRMKLSTKDQKEEVRVAAAEKEEGQRAQAEDQPSSSDDSGKE